MIFAYFARLSAIQDAILLCSLFFSDGLIMMLVSSMVTALLGYGGLDGAATGNKLNSGN